MEQIAKFLCDLGYILRSGGAPGADSAFEKGVDDYTKKEVYIPWKGFNERDNISDIFRISVQASIIASEIHPAWSRLTPAARRLHARNIPQVLGKHLESPSKFVVCWTEGSKNVGGTRTAIILARQHSIPVFNLALPLFSRLNARQLVYLIHSRVTSSPPFCSAHSCWLPPVDGAESG
jgi:hypothetical protein